MLSLLSTGWGLVATYGIATILLVAAAVIFGWPVFIQFFLGTKIGRLLGLIGGGFLAAILYGATQRREGTRAAEERQGKKDEKFIQEVDKRAAEIAASSDADVDSMLTDGTVKPGA